MYKANKYEYDFQQYQTIRSFGESIYKYTYRSKHTDPRLSIVLAQLKTGNTAKHLLNEIRQIIYALYPAKEITKKGYNNISNKGIIQKWILVKHSRTYDLHRLLLNLTYKKDLSDKYVALSNLSIYYTRKNIFKFQLQHGMENLNYLMDHILYQIFKTILNIY